MASWWDSLPLIPAYDDEMAIRGFNVVDWTGSRSERSPAAVPPAIRTVLVAALLVQIGWHAARPGPVAAAATVPAAPQYDVLAGVSMGEPAALAKSLMLWLQAFDNQPGVSIPFRQLDYERVVEWLDRILALDPRSRYPLLSAARVYAEVDDDEKRRIMLRFVREQFLEAPDERWQWMAHAVFVAKHRIRDMDLALRLASELRIHTSARRAPAWARQMELFVLEDMGEIDAAKVLLGGFIANGVVSDPNEIRFLKERLGE